ncbi:hypothetical protein SDC9_143188 [bioreactor metagenome]|uniref:Uncharacterized protein n=1 Tax=bioreactor metagenome TaxID=1076179 RepID=A0A645E657_9ZZZZ
MMPGVQEVTQPLSGYVRVEALNEFVALRGDAPVALAGVARAAHMAAHGDKRGAGDIHGVGAERDGLDNIGA